MWKTIALILIGTLLGVFIGSCATYAMLEKNIGDKYEIIRPKIKGNDNHMQIDQENLKTIDESKKRFRFRNKKNNRDGN